MVVVVLEVVKFERFEEELAVVAPAAAAALVVVLALVVLLGMAVVLAVVLSMAGVLAMAGESSVVLSFQIASERMSWQSTQAMSCCCYTALCD